VIEPQVGGEVEWTSAVRIEDGQTTYEIAVPWESLRKAGIRKTYMRMDPAGKLKKGRADTWNFISPVWFAHRPKTSRYTVRLHFAEPDDVQPGQRVFDVRLNGAVVLSDFDIVKEAGARYTAVVREFQGIEATGLLQVELVPKSKEKKSRTTPIISGLEVVCEREQDSQ
jgi:hypothetical protein